MAYELTMSLEFDSAEQCWDAATTQWKKAEQYMSAHLNAASGEYHYYMSEYSRLMAQYHNLKHKEFNSQLVIPFSN